MTVLKSADIVHLDVVKSLVNIRADPSKEGVLAVFWKDDIPLGARLFTPKELPVPASALPAVIAHAIAPVLTARGISDLNNLADAADEPAPLKVSVVICTYDRPDDLKTCLETLAKCYPQPDEIIIVDNAPNKPATRQLVETYPELVYVAEPRKGLSRARNAGLAMASGDIIAFTDDDVAVAENWVRTIADPFHDTDVAAVTGLVLPITLDSEAATFFELVYGGLANSFVPVRYDYALLDTSVGEAPPVWQVGAGANFALRASIVDEVGLFDVRLGAGATGCSEDSEMIYRILAAQKICAFDPTCVVFHSHRDNVRDLRKQLRAYLRGHIAALILQFQHDKRPGNLVRAFFGLPLWIVFATPLASLWHRDILRLKLWPWEIMGVFEGWFTLLFHRKDPPSYSSRHEELL